IVSFVIRRIAFEQGIEIFQGQLELIEGFPRDRASTRHPNNRVSNAAPHCNPSGPTNKQPNRSESRPDYRTLRRIRAARSPLGPSPPGPLRVRRDDGAPGPDQTVPSYGDHPARELQNAPALRPGVGLPPRVAALLGRMTRRP